MKTANIEIFHVWGTKSTTGCQVKYKGRTLHTFTDNITPNAMLKHAQDWILKHGFTHMKVTYC